MFPQFHKKNGYPDAILHEPIHRSCESDLSEISDITAPLANIIENEDRFIIEIAFAGVKSSWIAIGLADNVLTINAEAPSTDKILADFRRREFTVGPFSRSFMLPASIDGETISATYQDGMLSISISKKETMPSKTKVIYIS